MMGRLRGWLGAGGGGTTLPCMAGSGPKSNESHHHSGSGEERGQTWELGMCGCGGVGSLGPHLRCSHLLRSPVAVCISMHVLECVVCECEFRDVRMDIT